MSDSRSILVTGGAGFIGSCLVRRLIGQRLARVITLDKLTYAGNLDSLQLALNDPLHTMVRGDIGNLKLVRGLLEAHRPTAVVNLAAESHVDRSIDSPTRFLQTNVVGTFQLLHAVHDYWSRLDEPLRTAFRFLHISTDEVFGSLPPPLRCHEASPYAPNSPYAASKAAADHFVRAFFHTYGLPTITTHCCNNYGPFQFPEKLVPLMILKALDRKPLPVYGDGLQIRDWLFVEDHCTALLAVLDRGKPGATYNIGGHCEVTNLSMVRTLCEIVDELCPTPGYPPRTTLVTHVTDRPGHDRRYAVDADKATQDLGWRPCWDLEAGLRETVQWYLHNKQWVDRVTSGVYRLERLGTCVTTP